MSAISSTGGPRPIDPQAEETEAPLASEAGPAPAPPSAAASPAKPGAIPPTDAAKAAQIDHLLSDTSLAAGAFHRLFPGGKPSVPDQVLAILKSCPDAASLDAVVGAAGGRDHIVSRLGVAGSAQPVASLIDASRASSAKPGDWAGFDRYMDEATGTVARPGNSVTLLNDGKQAFPAIYGAIDSAKREVDVETFNYFDDATGKAFAQHLIDAAKRGCTVNVLMDTIGSDRHGGLAIASLLKANGVNVRETALHVLPPRVDHRKVIVCDGSTGFTGGMNIGDDWSSKWHDMHTEVKGPAVADLQSAFDDRWTTEGGRLPDRPPEADLPPAPAGNQTVRIVPHTGGQDENLKNMYLRAIDTAQSSIKIEDPYFTDPEIMQHLEAAARRGVDVSCVWPAQNNVKMAEDAGRGDYAALMAAGVKVYEYQPTMAHEKVCAIDGKLATVGSSNLDPRSLDVNNELNLVSLDPTLAGQLTSAIDADIAKSTRVTTAPKSFLDGLLDRPIIGNQL